MKTVARPTYSLFDGKICTKCGVWRLFDHFAKNINALDGMQHSCRRCQSKDPERYDFVYENRKQGLRHCYVCDQWLDRRLFGSNTSRRDGLRRECRACSRLLATRQYKTEPVEQRRARDRRRIAKHPDRNKIYHNTHRAQIRARKMRYYRSPEGQVAVSRGSHRRQTHLKNSPATLTPKEWVAILDEQHYCCAACHRPFTDMLRPTRDHIIPLSKGGPLTEANCQALCQSCNSRKNNRTIDYRHR